MYSIHPKSLIIRFRIWMNIFIWLFSTHIDAFKIWYQDTLMDLPEVSLKLKDYGILLIEESLYLVATFDLQGQAQLVSILLLQLRPKFDLLYPPVSRLWEKSSEFIELNDKANITIVFSYNNDNNNTSLKQMVLFCIALHCEFAT